MNNVLSPLQLGSKRIHTIRTRGGNKKYRALRLDTGNFSWGSEGELDWRLVNIDGLVQDCCNSIALAMIAVLY